jgi:uracil-DNA glycosylase family 4
MTPEEIRHRLEFYRDLGIDTIYNRPPKPAREHRDQMARTEPVATVLTEKIAAPDEPVRPVMISPFITASNAAPAIFPELVLPSLSPADDTLAKIREDIGDCKRCRLCEGRKKIVFGTGNEAARLVFVGEGPGADEDEQGIPFVGRAGQLLTQMIENTAAKEGIPIRRENVYICNVVKCRPPENRAPQPDEMEICGQFLYRQLMTIRPAAICALGATAMRALLNTKQGITKMRGEWQKWNGIPLMITYHPSYLLRQYNQEAKREAWLDLKKVLHFVYD